MEKEFYDVQDILDCSYNLQPLKCRYCESLEVDFNIGIGDAYCSNCGKWQLSPE